MKSREVYVLLAEKAAAAHDAAGAAVYVSLAQMADPPETVTVHGIDGEVRTDVLDSTVTDPAERENRCCEVVPLADGVPVALSDLRARITRQAVAHAIWGDQSPDWRTLDGLAHRGIGDYREVRTETLEAADRVVAMLLGRDT